MDPVQVFRLLRRRWGVLLALALLGALAGAASGVLAGEEADDAVAEIEAFSATHTLIVDLNASADARAEAQNLPQLAQRVVRGDIPVAVAAELGRGDPDALAATVSVQVRSDVQSLEITAVDLTDEGAVEVADAFADELLDTITASANERFQTAVDEARAEVERIEREIGDLNAELADNLFDDTIDEAERLETAQQIQGELERLDAQMTPAEVALGAAERALATAPDIALSTLDSATATTISETEYEARLRAGALGQNVNAGFTPQATTAGGGDGGSPIPDSPVARGLIGALLGLVIGVALVLIVERLDPRVRTKEDLEDIADLPVVAEVPALDRSQRRATDVLSHTIPRSRTAEAYRVLRSSLDYAEAVLRGRGERDREGATVILVTSPGPAEGKTTTTANLAAVLAERDLDVLVVNCDFRRPRLHDYLGGNDHPQKVNATTIPGVHLITHVTPHDPEQNPAEVVAAQGKVIERARARFDYILLDTAPLLTTNDANDVLDVADHVLLVAQASRTTAETVDRAVELLERRAAPVLGLVLVGARDVPGARGYYYEGDDPYVVSSRADKRSGRRREIEPATGEATAIDDRASAGTEPEPARASVEPRVEPPADPAGAEPRVDPPADVDVDPDERIPLVAAPPPGRRAARRAARARAESERARERLERDNAKASAKADKAAAKAGKAAAKQAKRRGRKPDAPPDPSHDEPATWGWPDRP